MRSEEIGSTAGGEQHHASSKWNSDPRHSDSELPGIAFSSRIIARKCDAVLLDDWPYLSGEVADSGV